MRKPDPTRILGRGKRKPDKLEMKGFSAPPLGEVKVKAERKTSISQTTTATTKLQTNRVTEFETYRLTDFDEYAVPVFRKLRRSELRLTWEQDEYLDNLKSGISRTMPEGNRSDPNYKRITKNSIVRALVELARRLDVTLDASKFKNERDLLKEIAKAFENKLTELQTNRVTE